MNYEENLYLMYYTHTSSKSTRSRSTLDRT